MAIGDKIKWDKKYSQKSELLAKRAPSAMVKKYYNKCSGKAALDIACGAGRNTLFLEEKGFFIDAIDISQVALDTLKRRVKSTRVKPILADLEQYNLGCKRYDFIVKCNFLDRALIERAKEALKGAGVMVVETYMEDAENEKRESNPNFLLQKDELLEIFNEGFEVLEYRTFWNESFEKYKMKKASIAVKKSE